MLQMTLGNPIPLSTASYAKVAHHFVGLRAGAGACGRFGHDTLPKAVVLCRASSQQLDRLV